MIFLCAIPSRHGLGGGCSVRGPHFCSIRVTEDLRKYAMEQGIVEKDSVPTGLAVKSQEFAQKRAEVYVTE